MAKKLEKFEVNGKALTDKEKRIYEFAQTQKEIIPSEVAEQGDLKDLNVFSVRATLARLEKTHGLVQSNKKLINDKLVTVYKKVN